MAKLRTSDVGHAALEKNLHTFKEIGLGAS